MKDQTLVFIFVPILAIIIMILLFSNLNNDMLINIIISILCFSVGFIIGKEFKEINGEKYGNN